MQKYDWAKWGNGLIAAVVSAAFGSFAVVIVNPETFNLREGLGSLIEVAVIFALIAAGNYLKSNPTPDLVTLKKDTDNAWTELRNHKKLLAAIENWQETHDEEEKDQHSPA